VYITWKLKKFLSTVHSKAVFCILPAAGWSGIFSGSVDDTHCVGILLQYYITSSWKASKDYHATKEDSVLVLGMMTDKDGSIREAVEAEMEKALQEQGFVCGGNSHFISDPFFRCA